MSHFIVKGADGSYLYHRRCNTGVVYEARAEWGPDKGQARVFTKRAAAKSSSNGVGEIIEVELVERKS